ncbi:MAG: ATP-binding protein, partial [Pirellulales bacterium]|nr:ATP-binding protein [Pirellulales bacterium]
MSSSEQVTIAVDPARALKVLRDAVFSERDASIRELIANASDSIHRLPPDQRELAGIHLDAHKPSPGTSDPAVLLIKDAGVGMTRQDAARFLGTMFASSKEDDGQAIGRFGIGFYSCLALCSKVEVLTCGSRTSAAKGTRVLYQGGDEISVQECELSEPGTTVRLELLPSHGDLVDQRVLSDLVQRHCDFVRWPIYLGEGQIPLNRQHAPWYEESPPGADLEAAIRQHFDVDDIFATFAVNEFVQGVGQVRGVFFVATGVGNPSLRLYSRRVLVNWSDRLFFDDSLRSFVYGILDVDEIPLTISRDTFVASSAAVKRLRKRMIEFLAEQLEQYSERYESDFQRLAREFGAGIKDACLEHVELLDRLQNRLPYRTSMRSSATVPQYIGRHTGGPIIFSDDPDSDRSLLPLYKAANIEVLFMTDAADRQFRDGWVLDGDVVQFQRLDVSPPNVDVGQDSAEISPKIREALALLFQSEIDSSLQVKVQALGSDAPASVLAVSEEQREKMKFVEVVEQHRREGRVKELPTQIQEL